MRISRIRLSLRISPQACTGRFCPTDPVIQCIKPELRFLFGLLAQFLSQLENFPRHRVSASPFFRNGRLRQAVLPPSDSTFLPQGPFAPRELPRFLATTDPSATHPGRSRLFIPASRWFSTTRQGFPGSSTSLSPRAASNHPGDSVRCLLIASPPVSGFTLVGRLANPCVLTRPNRVCLRCGSWVRSSGASASRISPPAARLLHAE